MSPTCYRRTLGAIVTLWVGTAVSPTFAALPPAESLVPATTTFFVTCRNIGTTEAALKRTKFGGLFDDESLKPFVDDVRRQLEARLQEAETVPGLRFADLKNLSDGEAALAVAAISPQKTGTVVVVDVTGHQAELANVRKKITASLQQRNAQSTAYQTPAGAQGTQYQVPPPKPGQRPIEVFEVLHRSADGDLWIVGDGAEIVDSVSTAMATGGAGLAQSPSFSTVMTRTMPIGNEPPRTHFAVFVDPLGLSSALRQYEFPPKKHKPDPIEVFRGAGFDGLRAVGAQVTFDVGNYGVLVRGAVLAPEPRQKSMKMFKFVPGADFAPQPWVAPDVTGYATIYWDLMEAFNNFGPLFGGFLEEDESIWWEVIKSLKEDPDGPQVDLVNDFMALLAERATAVVDKKLPITADSSQLLITVELKKGANEAADKSIAEKVATTLKKAFANDPSAERTIVEGLETWKINFREDAPPGEVAPQAGTGAANAADAEPPRKVIATALVTVWNGHLVIAGDEDMLIKTIKRPVNAPGLATAPDYVAVTAELGNYIPKQVPTPVMLGFQRLDELLRIDYELARAGKLSESTTIIGRLLYTAQRDPETGVQKPVKIDGTKLPPFAAVQKYLSPFGTLMSNTPDGMIMVGFSLEKLPDAAAAR